MNAELDAKEIRARLIPLRLIIGAMVGSQILFALVATVLLASGMGGRGDLSPWLLGALVMIGAGEFTAWPLIRRTIARPPEREGPVTLERAFEAFFRLHLVGAAMAEGFGIFGVVAYIVIGNKLALLAPAVGIFTLLRLQPGPDAFRDFARGLGVANVPR